MNKSEKIFSKLKKNRLIALLTPKSIDQCVTAYELLNPHNIILEVAFRSEFALDGIKAIINKYPEALILAGTVMTKEYAESAIKAGVAGIVSADFIPEVVETCVKHDVMSAPGGLSDVGKQLAYKAKAYDCSLEELRINRPYQWIYKLFPTFVGESSNMEMVKIWQGPFKDLTVVYSGGIALEQVSKIVKYDPEAIICGSSLVKNVNDIDKFKEDILEWKEKLNPVPEVKASTPLKQDQTVEGGKKIVTFGEIMLRLSPRDNQRFVQANSFEINYGGAEANVAVALANYGFSSNFVTALPNNEIGQAAINSLRKYGVDTRIILRQGNRIGIYYLEHGASQRPSNVIYDRAGSSISEIQPGELDWEKIFRDASWFHWSGITPALSDNAAKVTLEALKAAKKTGLTVSVDLNYRKKLWNKEKASSVMNELMEYVNICIGNEEDAEMIFGIKAESTDLESESLNKEAYKKVAKKLYEKFRLRKVAITIRESTNASDNDWSAVQYNGKDFFISKTYSIHIVDRIGGGDSFSAGLIYGLISGMSDKDSLEFGVAASCLKQTIHGDFNLTSVNEIEQLVNSKGRGRIQR